MPSAKELQRRLLAIKPKIAPKVKEIILNDQLIIESKIDEFQRGLRPDGNIIGTYSSAFPEYAEFKEKINPLANGNVDLIFSGSFSGKLFVVSTSESSFLFNSRDSKKDKLVRQYGKDIMGLNKETFKDLQIKVYKDKLVRFINKNL